MGASGSHPAAQPAAQPAALSSSEESADDRRGGQTGPPTGLTGLMLRSPAAPLVNGPRSVITRSGLSPTGSRRPEGCMKATLRLGGASSGASRKAITGAAVTAFGASTACKLPLIAITPKLAGTGHRSHRTCTGTPHDLEVGSGDVLTRCSGGDSCSSPRTGTGTADCGPVYVQVQLQALSEIS